MYPFGEIATIVNGRLINGRNDNEVDSICFDTRRILQKPNQLFVALSGRNGDGHLYLKEAYSKGISLFLISDEKAIFPGANFILVPDTLKALQTWASVHRKKSKAQVLGITGSNGKTVIKEWIAHLVGKQLKVAKTPASYNSQLGVALSIVDSPLDADLLIIESGISKKGEMSTLQAIIEPGVVLFTNLGSAHNAGFESKDEKLREKLLLAKNATLLIYRKDHKLVHDYISSHFKQNTLSWSIEDEKADIYFVLETKIKQTLIKTKYNNNDYRWVVEFTDPISIENILHALAFILYKNLKIAKNALALLPVLNQRLEKHEGWRNCNIFNDSYSLDEFSLKLALESLQSLGKHRTKTLILSALDEVHLDQKDAYPRIIEQIKTAPLDCFIFIGPSKENKSRFLRSLANYHYQSTEEMILQHPFYIHQEEDILIKGARMYKLEKIADHLNRQLHSTVLEINLKSIEHNLQVFRNLVKPNTKIIAVIKAGAYGSGDGEIAHFLEEQSIDYLAVAYLDEAINLRNKGVTAPIIVLTPSTNNLTIYYEYDLELQIISIDQLVTLTHQLNHELKIHLNIDTGMSRNGILPEELDTFIKLYKSHPYLKLTSVFSHLSSADQATEDPFTKDQFSLFDRSLKTLKTQIKDSFFTHILNTSGLLRFPSYQYDAVRIGLGLYGLGSTKGIELERAHSLKSTLVNIKRIEKGKSIGYSRTEKTNKPITIGIVPIGYADGLIRKCGNRRFEVYIEGTPCAIIGNVSMDMIMIDLTDIKHPKAGMSVILFNQQYPIEKLAKAADTIEYEVLSRIAPRVKRVIIRS